MEALNEAAFASRLDGHAVSEPLVSVVLPCLDEAESVADCVQEAQRVMAEAGVDGEVVVADNGSQDGSGDLARAVGARVVREPRRGYGSAYRAGFSAARGRYIVMADADGSYDLSYLPRFIELLQEGADLVIGSRLRGRIQPGAMPWLHRRIGVPILTGILNLFFRAKVSDAHCGMRAFRRDLLPRLRLRTVGMELASEQIVRAGKLGLEIREIPIEYRARAGTSKLSTFNDGWRHLRLLLVHSPTWLFVIPGLLLLGVGLVGVTTVLGHIPLFGRSWQLHALIASVMAAVTGSQLAQFGVFARSYAAWHLGERDDLFEWVRARLRLETVLLAGIAILFSGLIAGAVVFVNWLKADLGQLDLQYLAVVALGLGMIGIQVLFGGFLLSVLGLGGRSSTLEPVPPAAAATSTRVDGQPVSQNRSLAGTTE